MLNEPNRITRRRFAAGLTLGSVALALPLPAMALTVDQARALIGKAIGEVNTTINSGKSGESDRFRRFGRVFGAGRCSFYYCCWRACYRR